ncbi:DUF4190 domain-containing protein [Nocardioides zeae]|uniref:DUF4190 domain-containing protein n=1 Tax=Nocardioides imazamoxiresistens TaxID=3231893 RepID=A0ABU3PUY0_9ACTN|nr:DUF4190 domain-containing protein [Nocardioides zeae]MDT9592647.1 DUF4190 domain-containing protein [Nocardioides zeae]
MTEQKVPTTGTEGQAPQGAHVGHAGYAAPWPPQQPPAPQGGSGLAITALVVAVVSLLLCWVPIVNNLFAVTALVAVVLGLVAARRAKKGRAGGLGMARAGWIVGLVALAGVLATQAFYVAVLDEVGEEIERSSEEAQQSFDELEDEADGDSAASSGDVEQQVAAEEAGEVRALGTSATVGDYEVTVSAVDVEADAAIAAANQFNPAPDGRYVLATLDVTYVGADEGTPWMDLTTTFVGSDARNYDEYSCDAVTPNAGYDQPTLTPGGRATFDVCFDVSLAALTAPQVYVEDMFSFGDESREYWNVG